MKSTYELEYNATKKTIMIPKELADELKELLSGCHINFLLGAGYSYGILDTLGNMEYVFEGLRLYRSDNSNKMDKALILKAYMYWLFFIKCAYPVQSVVPTDSRMDPFLNFSDILFTILSEKGNPVLNRQCNIFTTNYDPINEIAFDHSKCICNDGFEGRITPIFGTDNYSKIYYREALFSNRKAEIPSVNLIKIHGSITWKIDGKDKIVYQDYRTGLEEFYEKHKSKFDKVILNDIKSFFSKVDKTNVDSLINNMISGTLLDPIISLKADFHEMLEEYSNNILIVNPTKEKFSSTLLNKNYYELLRIYTNELEKENTLLVAFGFSFRDEHILDLTKRSLVNPSLKLLIFCYSEKEIDQYKLLFRNAKNNNISYIYIKGKYLTIDEFNQIFRCIHA